MRCMLCKKIPGARLQTLQAMDPKTKTQSARETVRCIVRHPEVVVILFFAWGVGCVLLLGLSLLATRRSVCHSEQYRRLFPRVGFVFAVAFGAIASYYAYLLITMINELE